MDDIPEHYAEAARVHKLAGKLVQGDRRKTHGDFADNFQTIAWLWSAYLKNDNGSDFELTAFDVSQMMVLLKIARSLSGGNNPDNYVDAIGYSMISAGLAAMDH
jgi:hypothetical protein